MVSRPLFHQLNGQSRSSTVRDQVQMALAIADPTLLKSMLTHCMPAIADPCRIGTVSSEVGVPIQDQLAADGILHYESIQCVLATQPQVDTSTNSGWTRSSKEVARLTQHESEMQTLGQNLSLATAIALLTNSGFNTEQVKELLRLPHYAWYKSWWCAIDANGEFTQSFLRCLRTFHFPNGTLTLQYKDFFEQEKPQCFTSIAQKALVVLRCDAQGFAETLQQINRQRTALNIQPTILIAQTLTELEAQAFIRQGISLYLAKELILPMQAACDECAWSDCPMNGTPNSPVALCHRFTLEGDFV